MENLEQKTEKTYKTGIGDWIPGYGMWKTCKALGAGEPNIMDISGDLGYWNALYQCGSCVAIGDTIAEYLL